MWSAERGNSFFSFRRYAFLLFQFACTLQNICLFDTLLYLKYMHHHIALRGSEKKFVHFGTDKKNAYFTRRKFSVSDFNASKDLDFFSIDQFLISIGPETHEQRRRPDQHFSEKINVLVIFSTDFQLEKDLFRQGKICPY